MSSPTLTVNDALRQAIEHHQSQRFAEAERLYRLILSHHPGHPDANHNLGMLAVQAARPFDAVPLFRAAFAAMPAHPQFRVSLCLALLETGAADEAQRLVDEAKAEGQDGPAFDAVRQRLSQARGADKLTASLNALVAQGSLPMPQLPRNRAQRRAAARDAKGRTRP